MSFTIKRILALLGALLLLVIASGCSDNTTLDLTDEELRPTVANWVNMTGLNQDDTSVWRTRLTEACADGVWDDDVAHRLAEKYVSEDLDLALEGVQDSEVLRDDAAQALWLMARQVCPDDFPEGEIDDGPPPA